MPGTGPSNQKTAPPLARILAVSSHVAYGHVGLAAIVPVLQAMQHDVIAVPSAVLSSHNGYRIVGGQPLPSEALSSILTALAANGWLATLDAVLTGYLPSALHVDILARQLETLPDRGDRRLILCDPVLGDDPHGLYVADDVATAIRDRLVPLADVLTPNRFELAWLSGVGVSDVLSAAAAARRLGRPNVVATSVPSGGSTIANVLVADGCAASVATRCQQGVPSGTGDVFAALLLGHLLAGRSAAAALACATAGTETVIAASLGAGELRLVETVQQLAAAAPLAIEEIG